MEGGSIFDGGSTKKSFITHVFSANEEDKAEFLNVLQYSFMGVIPVIILNKLIQRFIPEADSDKSNIEILFEIFVQITVIFCGIILIHRSITYFPTYSGFKYDNLILTNVVLAFLIIVLSIQTKLGIKVNIIIDNLMDLWNGKGSSEKKEKLKKNLRVAPSHTPSQSDFLDTQQSMFPPAPMSSSSGHVDKGYTMAKPAPMMMDVGPMPANSFGGGFGSF